jgi:zinc D-Ala-D-Ala carboxypeptidase
MKRRQVITGFLAVAGASVWLSGASRYRVRLEGSVSSDNVSSSNVNSVDLSPPLIDPLNDHENRFAIVPAPIATSPASMLSPNTPITNNIAIDTPAELSSDTPKAAVAANTVSIMAKSMDFDRNYEDDIWIAADEKLSLHSVTLRLKNLQGVIGYGNFNILNVDDALSYAKRFSQVGEFTPTELQFIEKIFAYNAADYGFYGEKVITSLSKAINKDHTFKVPHTGHYLFKEQSFAYYEKIRKSVGEGVILTSGIRSIVKQLHLFLAKVISVNGNLSRASRSLAPPGYSYHGIGDFDVGRKGWGEKNFTDAFSQTDEFKRMQDLGYVAIRYDVHNTLGVRFEPWHIKVV